MLLISCAQSISGLKPNLPVWPQGLLDCENEPIPDLPGKLHTALNNDQVTQAIGDQRTAAFSKNECAKNGRLFYEDLRSKLMSNGGTDGRSTP